MASKKIQKTTARLWRLSPNDRGETGTDEMFVSVVDEDVSWGEVTAP